MNVQMMNVDRDAARLALRKYQEHRAWQAPHDAEIARIYEHIAKGRTIIGALASIAGAGLDANGRPKLAIARADRDRVRLGISSNSARFDCSKHWSAPRNAPTLCFDVPMPGLDYRTANAEAVVPLIPIHLRPKRGLANYHVLWEAEWSKIYPRDPYLLRRIGGDAWLVVAAWDLTDVERAVMSARLRA